MKSFGSFGFGFDVAQRARSGEMAKSIEFNLFLKLRLTNKYDRATVLIAVGGGVIGDLVGNSFFFSFFFALDGE